jgi:hypothetical protein
MAPTKLHSLAQLSVLVLSLLLIILPQAIDSFPTPYSQAPVIAPEFNPSSTLYKKKTAMDIFLTSIRSRLEEEPSNNVIVVTGNESAGKRTIRQNLLRNASRNKIKKREREQHALGKQH